MLQNEALFSFPFLSISFVGVMSAQESLIFFPCCYIEGLVRSIGSTGQDNDNEEKDTLRKVRSLLIEGSCTCEVCQKETRLR